MNFYSFHIGDYASKTRHLTWDQDLSYRRLIEAYYAYELPLPLDRQQLYRIISAQTPRQKKSVDDVISEFFQEATDGYHHLRCDEEIATVKEKSAKASKSARIRWGAEAERTHGEGNAPRTHYPEPTTHERTVGVLDWGSIEAQLRKAAGWEREAHPRLAVVGPIVTLLEAGADLERDVLPIVKGLAPGVTTRTSWAYFIKPIEQAWRQRTGYANGTTQRPSSQPVDAEKWKSRLATARKRKQWDEKWGPFPNQQGSLVPAALVQPGDGKDWTVWRPDA